MKNIASFEVDHTKLRPGLYTVRHQHNVTTFDLRFVRPSHDIYIPQAAIHTIIHLGNTFFRMNLRWHDKVVYFGPMACRTGCYLLLHGWHTVDSKGSPVYLLVKEMLEYIVKFEGEIPGATEKECGNYKEHDLLAAKEWARKYLHALKKPHFEYP